ncbi:conserved hypothetical protein [Candidatus Pelagibacter sp. HTCC7211]|uniref:hypothetical protein n=1 Tax=Pelagibacter sp. (strain HTCC7211) TaxID=439493 RepID=UPI000183AC8F|nr:hypothetical protein [Candidatus Pelagibacter sp. HTCC7211]EDZ60691.1 conserved hypothetical protein [Candidatus Pelagibacter sp. HTCC7211]MBD1151419.1 hypothetical protein [Pelagibacterales bacterium SAG-MED25]
MNSSYKCKKPSEKNNKYIENFFIKKGLKLLVDISKKKKPSVNEMKINEPFIPELNDLYNLYQYILINKRTTILEFGSGWSTLIFSLALKELKNKFSNEVKSLRRNNPFELFVLESEKKYLKITKNRIKKFYKYLKIKDPIKINYYYSDVEMTTFNNRICTQYKKLPLCNPDFIYLDGPGQFIVKKNINGITTTHKDMMPMVSDILKFEYFYTPGTIIVCDGRAANTKFLKDHFKRNWKYISDKKNDQHIFCLVDPSLGKYSNLQIKFYNKSN